MKHNRGDDLASQLASSVSFGAPSLTASATDLSLTYLGPAPGKVAIDQANALGQWKGWPQGCKVPLSLTLLEPQVVSNVNAPGMAMPASLAPFTYSQLVDVSIQPGGGKCADPSNSGLGIITWQKNTVSDVGGISSTEAVTAQFIESSGLGFPRPGPAGTPLPPLTFSFPYYPLYGPFAAPRPRATGRFRTR